MWNDTLKQLRPALVLFALLTLLTGFAYPLLVTGAAQVIFPQQAGGSLIESEGQVIGSELIGQAFDSHPAYFWGRPSATGPAYNAAASSGSNYGPSSQALMEAVQARIAALQAADPENTAPIPVDLVTASASGLDPHISPAAASYQAGRVAAARGLELSQVQALIADYTENPTLGLLGEARVNVLLLNLALDDLAPLETRED